MNTYTLILSFLLLTGTGLSLHKVPKIKPISKKNIKVPEPSDICYSAKVNGFFVVSDNGLLFQLDKEGNVVKKAKAEGADYEGVWADDNFVYVVDESLRQIIKYDINTLEIKERKLYSYLGGRNRGWESIAFDAQRNRYVLFTETKPVLAYEIEPENLSIINTVKIKSMKEISAATYHDGNLYALSDENMEIYLINTDDYSVEHAWKIPILNPEGLTFLPDGTLIVVSDDLEKMYTFAPLTKTEHKHE